MMLVAQDPIPDAILTRYAKAEDRPLRDRPGGTCLSGHAVPLLDFSDDLVPAMTPIRSGIASQQLLAKIKE